MTTAIATASPSMKVPFLARKTTHYLLIAGTVFVLMTGVFRRDAYGMVVFDPTNFMANIEQYYTDVEKLKTAYDQLNALYRQIQTAEAQLNALTSKNGWQQLVTNRPSWLPKSYDDTQHMLDAGYNPGDADDVGRYRQKYDATFRPLTQQQVSRSPNDRNWVVYQNTVANTSNAMATSQKLFENIAQYDKTLQAIQPTLGATDDLKSSVDLTNTLLYQSMAMQLDSMRAMQQQLQMAAVNQNQDLNAMAVNTEFAGQRFASK